MEETTVAQGGLGTLKDLKTYRRIQDSIFGFCETAGVPPLVYDFLAWDGAHTA